VSLSEPTRKFWRKVRSTLGAQPEQSSPRKRRRRPLSDRVIVVRRPGADTSTTTFVRRLLNDLFGIQSRGWLLLRRPVRASTARIDNRPLARLRRSRSLSARWITAGTLSFNYFVSEAVFAHRRSRRP